jgi:hypothetical protein
MAYLLVWTESDGDKNWRLYADEAEAYDAAREFRRLGLDPDVLSTELADAGGDSPRAATPGFRT